MINTQNRLASRTLMALALAMTAGPLLAQDTAPFEGLATEMTAEQRRATGVESLTPVQRAALDAWLRARINGNTPAMSAPAAATATADAVATDRDVPPRAPMVPATPTAVASSDEAAREAAIEAEVERRVAVQMATPQNAAEVAERGEPFTATLQGPFKGWTGKTLFRLDNGHVWKQRGKKRYFYNGSDLRVSFKQNFMGGWEMTLVGPDKTVLVTPVR